MDHTHHGIVGGWILISSELTKGEKLEK